MRYFVVDTLEYVTAQGTWWHHSQQDKSLSMCLHMCEHTLGRVRNYSIREFSRKLLFHSSLVGFPQSLYYNAIVWQSLNSHQLSPQPQACMQPA